MSGPLRWILPEQLLEKCQTQQNRPVVFKLGPGDQQGHLNGLSGVRSKRSNRIFYVLLQFLGVGKAKKKTGMVILIIVIHSDPITD